MFSNLSDKLSKALSKFKNKGKLTAADVKEGMREVKLALLEADVNYRVVKDFVASVSERAVGAEVLESLVPAQQIIKIVNEELTAIMGGSVSKLNISPKPPTVVMVCGLQGAGKTTHCAKLAAMYKKREGKRPMLAACDVYRPAAIKQLQVLGEQIDVPVFTLGDSVSPVEIAKAALKEAERNGNDILFLDTAGRLHIDEELMEELRLIKESTSPAEILLVIDSMTGQDAVNVAKSFNDLLDITGVILTKLDGDTRGGAALSVRHITGKPIKFIGTGEKLDLIEPFHPDRMAQRILGMGDVLTLIEKAQHQFDEKQAAELEQKMRTQTFTLSDYLDQLNQIKGMGSIESLLGMIPGMNQSQLKDVKVDEKALAHTEAMILSMTEAERRHPEIINASRKKRICAGSGTKVEELNRLLKQFEAMKKMMKQMTGKEASKMMRRVGKKGKLPFGF